MFFAFQIPLVDVRPFVHADTSRLTSPTWPLPTAGKEFVRAFGQVSNRPRGGVERWSGESSFCGATRALRFLPPLPTQRIGLRDQPSQLWCVYRRFFTDGQSVSRLEVGLRLRWPEKYSALDRSELLELIQRCLAITVQIPTQEDKKQTCDLISADQRLSRHYLLATTRLSKRMSMPTEDWWVRPGEPLLLVEAALADIPSLPRQSRVVRFFSEASLELSYCRFQIRGKELGVWFVRLGESPNRDIQRRLRVHLFRLHSERQCLKQIFRLVVEKKIQVERGSAPSEALQGYLQKALGLLTSPLSNGFQQNGILAAVQEFEDIVAPGEREDLLAALESIRGNILRGISRITEPKDVSSGSIVVMGSGNTVLVGSSQRIGEQRMSNFQITFGDNATVHGDFVVATTIQNSFNKAANSSAKQDVKDQLKQLHQAVAEMTKHLPVEKARDAAKDLEVLTTEAVSEAPRKKWYDLSAEGLIEAAKTVGEIAAPVVTCVKALLGLLA